MKRDGDMIGSVFFALALLFAVSAAPVPAAAEAAQKPPTDILPDETIVIGLRRARIAGLAGEPGKEKALLDSLVAAHPTDPTTLAAAFALARSTDERTESTRALRAQLASALAENDRRVALPVLWEIARDKAASPDELARVIQLLAAHSGPAADRLARERLRIDLLERVGRRAEALVALDALAAADPDPLVTFRLLSAYREAGRWDDVLRVTARTDESNPINERGWWRLEALGALSRYDEVLSEAQALIGQWRASPGVPAILSPYAAERFFGFVFLLTDAGRKSAAERLVADLAAASGGVDSVTRLRVMLFGSPDDRMAFLASAAGASIASDDPEKIRAEAYQRLLSKDYATAHELYRRLQQLDPAVSALDGGDWFNDGLAAVETGAWPDVETAMTHAIESGVSKSRALAHRARAKIMLGRITEGIADAEAALAIDAHLKQGCYAMYLAYQKLGDSTKAEAWLARFKAP